MNCPKCNFPVSLGQRFCESCGAMLMPVEIDTEKTIAADMADIPEIAAQPEPQQSAWAPPVQPEPETVAPPVQPEPETAAPPVQPEPEAVAPPVQPEPEAVAQPVQPEPEKVVPPAQSGADNASPEWPGGGSVASAWDQPQQTDFTNQYQQPSYYSGNQYGYSPAPAQGAVKTANKKKIAIIIASAVVAVGLIVGLILIIVSCAGGGSHKIEISGKTVADDSSINTGDSAAEKKINDFINAGGNGSTTSQMGTMKVYGKGNAVVYEERLFSPIPESERASYQALAKQSLSGSSSNLASARVQSGVSDLVAVYALFDGNGDLIYSEVIK